MKTHRARMLAALFFFACARTALADPALTPKNFAVNPPLVYATEDKAVLFTVQLPLTQSMPEQFEMTQHTAAAAPVKFRYVLRDDGTFGDLVAHDGTYSRKIYFQESHAQTIFFRVEQLNAQLIVDRRPSFLELMQKVWWRFQHPHEPFRIRS